MRPDDKQNHRNTRCVESESFFALAERGMEVVFISTVSVPLVFKFCQARNCELRAIVECLRLRYREGGLCNAIRARIFR